MLLHWARRVVKFITDCIYPKTQLAVLIRLDVGFTFRQSGLQLVALHTIIQSDGVNGGSITFIETFIGVLHS